MPVRAMGRTNAGMFASRASAADVHRTGSGSASGAPLAGAVPWPASSRANGQPGFADASARLARAAPTRRRGRSARRATGRPGSRRDWSASPSRSRTRGTRRRPRASRRSGGPTVCSFIGLSHGTQRNFIGDSLSIRGCPEAAARPAPGSGPRGSRAVPRTGSPDRSAGPARDRTGRSRGRGFQDRRRSSRTESGEAKSGLMASQSRQ